MMDTPQVALDEEDGGVELHLAFDDFGSEDDIQHGGIVDFTPDQRRQMDEQQGQQEADDEASNAESSTDERLDLMMMKYFSEGSFMDESGVSLAGSEGIHQTIDRIGRAMSPLAQSSLDRNQLPPLSPTTLPRRFSSPSFVDQNLPREEDHESEGNPELLVPADIVGPTFEFPEMETTVFPELFPIESGVEHSEEPMIDDFRERWAASDAGLDVSTKKVKDESDSNSVLVTPPHQPSLGAKSEKSETTPSSVAYGVEVWKAALRLAAVEQEEKTGEDGSVFGQGALADEDDATSIDSDEELERWAFQIRSEIRQTEMMELAIAAERAAEKGEEKFSCHASTYGCVDDEEGDISFPSKKDRSTVGTSRQDLALLNARKPSLRRPGLMRRQTHETATTHSTTSTNAKQLTPRTMTRKKLRVSDLRNVTEVIPLMSDLHVHLQSHLHRNGIDTQQSLFEAWETRSRDGRSTVGSDSSRSRISLLRKFAGWVSPSSSKDSGIAQKITPPSKNDDGLGETPQHSRSDDSEDVYDIGNTLADHTHSPLSKEKSRPPRPIRIPKGLVLPEDDFDTENLPKFNSLKNFNVTPVIRGDSSSSGDNQTALTCKTTTTSSTNPAMEAPIMTPLALDFNAEDNTKFVATAETPLSIDEAPFTPILSSSSDSGYPKSDPGVQIRPLELPNLFITPMRLRGIKGGTKSSLSLRHSTVSDELHRSFPNMLLDSFLIGRTKSMRALHEDNRRKVTEPRSAPTTCRAVDADLTNKEMPSLNLDSSDTSHGCRADELPLSLRRLAPPSIPKSQSAADPVEREKEESPEVAKVEDTKNGTDISKLFHEMTLKDVTGSGDFDQIGTQPSTTSDPTLDLALPTLSMDLGDSERKPMETPVYREPQCSLDSDADTPKVTSVSRDFGAQSLSSPAFTFPDISGKQPKKQGTEVVIEARDSSPSRVKPDVRYRSALNLIKDLDNHGGDDFRSYTPFSGSPSKTDRSGAINTFDSSNSDLDASSVVVNLEASFVNSSGQESFTRKDHLSGNLSGIPDLSLLANPSGDSFVDDEKEEAVDEIELSRAGDKDIEENLIGCEPCATFECDNTQGFSPHRRTHTADFKAEFSESGDLRRVTSCPQFPEIDGLTPDSPLAPLSPRTLDEIRKGGKQAPLSPIDVGCMSDVSHSESLKAAMEVLSGRNTSVSATSELKTFETATERALHLSVTENHEFLKNYLFCSKEPEEKRIDVQSTLETPRFCAENCGPGVDEDVSSFCAGIDGLRETAKYVFPMARRQSGKELIGLIASDPTIVRDSWLEQASDHFDSTIERLVGNPRRPSSCKDANFKAPTHAMKTPQSARRKNIDHIQRSNSTPAGVRRNDSLRLPPSNFSSKSHDVSDRQYEFTYSLSRHDFSKRLSSKSLAEMEDPHSLKENPSWGNSSNRSLRENQSWRSNAGSTAGSTGSTVPNLQVPRSQSGLVPSEEYFKDQARV